MYYIKHIFLFNKEKSRLIICLIKLFFSPQLVYGNAVCGPTAEDVPDRTIPSFDPTTHLQLTSKAKQLIPKLKDFNPVGHYMGVRPATQFKDYQITAYPSRQVFLFRKLDPKILG